MAGQGKIGKVVFFLVAGVIFLYLLAPMIAVVFSSFGKEAYPQFPPKAYSLRWYMNFLHDDRFTSSLIFSVYLAGCTTFLALLIGVPCSLALVQYRFPGSTLLNTFCMSPILFPAVVIGIALMVFYSKLGITRSFQSLLFAHVMMTIPFVIRLVSSSLYGLDRSLEEASLNLGANRMRTFFRITLPLIKPGIVAGGVFAFFISFDEVVVSLFLAGPKTTTLPIRIFTFVEYSSDPTVAAVSTFMILVTLCTGVPVAIRFFGIRR